MDLKVKKVKGLVTQLCSILCGPMDCTHHSLLSMEFSRQEYWSGLLFPSAGDLPDSEIEPVSLKSPALAGGFYTTSTTWEVLEVFSMIQT